MTTTCKPCGATFGGRAEHCTECHATFSGTTAGDMHRTGDHTVSSGPSRRRCLTLAEMAEKGMTVTSNAHGVRLWSRGDAGYKDGAPQKQPFWHAQDESPGLAGSPWGNVPQVIFSARKSEVRA